MKALKSNDACKQNTGCVITLNVRIKGIMVLHKPEFDVDPFREVPLRYLGYANESTLLICMAFWV